MILDRPVGDLVEPLTGRVWPGAGIGGRCLTRRRWYRERGVRAGDRVLAHQGNTLEFLVDLIAVWSLGASVVPMDLRLTAFEVETLARAARPRLSAWLGAPDAAVAARLTALGVDVADVSGGSDPPGPDGAAGPDAFSFDARPDDDALVLFTSGSTSAPKGVVHTHRSLVARWTSLAERLGTEPQRRTLCLLPFHFGHGLICNALFPWLHGATLLVLPPFRPDIVIRLGSVLDEHRITFMSSVPALWRLALRTARPPTGRSLERVFCGSAPLSAPLWREIREWSGAPVVANVYGITETGSWLAGAVDPDVEPADGLVGEAWGGRFAVMRGERPPTGPAASGPDLCAPGEEGRVWVSTPALMRGYLGRDDLTAEAVVNGWFRTGDIGLLDARGRLVLRGREREEINRGGSKVYPSDVDAVIDGFVPAVDACAFGYEDGQGQEEVGVALALAPGADATLGALYRWCRERLAAHQMPRRWYRVDAIPRSPRGKVNRAAVAALCAGLAPLGLRGVARGPEGGAGG
jgi:acyl-CoA synthetase (AMP-forming)/AMP-acid ligase II